MVTQVPDKTPPPSLNVPNDHVSVPQLPPLPNSAYVASPGDPCSALTFASPPGEHASSQNLETSMEYEPDDAAANAEATIDTILAGETLQEDGAALQDDVEAMESNAAESKFPAQIPQQITRFTNFDEAMHEAGYDSEGG